MSQGTGHRDNRTAILAPKSDTKGAGRPAGRPAPSLSLSYWIGDRHDRLAAHQDGDTSEAMVLDAPLSCDANLGNDPLSALAVLPCFAKEEVRMSAYLLTAHRPCARVMPVFPGDWISCCYNAHRKVQYGQFPKQYSQPPALR
jgi:hypothetical protein